MFIRIAAIPRFDRRLNKYYELNLFTNINGCMNIWMSFMAMVAILNITGSRDFLKCHHIRFIYIGPNIDCAKFHAFITFWPFCRLPLYNCKKIPSKILWNLSTWIKSDFVWNAMLKKHLHNFKQYLENNINCVVWMYTMLNIETKSCISGNYYNYKNRYDCAYYLHFGQYNFYIVYSFWNVFCVYL